MGTWPEICFKALSPSEDSFVNGGLGCLSGIPLFLSFVVLFYKRLPNGCALQPQQQRVVRRKVTEPTITGTDGKESGRIGDEEQQVSLKDPQDGGGRAAGVPRSVRRYGRGMRTTRTLSDHLRAPRRHGHAEAPPTCGVPMARVCRDTASVRRPEQIALFRETSSPFLIRHLRNL